MIPFAFILASLWTLWAFYGDPAQSYLHVLLVAAVGIFLYQMLRGNSAAAELKR